MKWSWQPAGGGHETDVLVAIGNRQRTFGGFRDRVHLRQASEGDVSIIITGLQLNDTGRFRCEVIDGLEDETVTIDLELRGIVCPAAHLKCLKETTCLITQCLKVDVALMCTEVFYLSIHLAHRVP